jgi:hypothetical protein
LHEYKNIFIIFPTVGICARCQLNPLSAGFLLSNACFLAGFFLPEGNPYETNSRS